MKLSWPVLSLALNVGLVVACAWAWQGRKPLPPAPVTAAATSTVQAKARPAPPPFHWRQLDAPDFATYAQNLRDIGCPEVTIADIIQAELRAIYDGRRAEIRQELAAAPLSAGVLDQRLRQVTVEETAAFAAVLPPVPAGSAATSPVPPDPAQGGAASDPGASAPPAVPVVTSTFKPVAFVTGEDPALPAPVEALSLTPTDPALDTATAAVLTSIRQDFGSTMAAAGADTSSAVYHERWQAAQRRSDDTFSSLFGGDAYVRAQIQAAQNDHRARQQPAK